MKKLVSKWMTVAGLAGGVLTFGLVATATAAPSTERSQSTTDNGQTRTQLTHATATIAGIDHKARTVMLKTDEGEETTVNVPQDVKAFDKLKVGDKVDIDYYESLAISMMPGAGKPSVSERRGRSVDMGGGMTGREITMTAEVVSVDPTANTVTFKGPKGMRTIHVMDPAMRQKLPALKPGQMVQFDYTEAMATSIRPAAGNK
jgi:hypothetical protein